MSVIVPKMWMGNCSTISAAVETIIKALEPLPDGMAAEAAQEAAEAITGRRRADFGYEIAQEPQPTLLEVPAAIA